MNSKVEIYTNTISGPELSSDNANFVVIRDNSGKPVILLVRLAGDTWGICNAADSDWNTVLKRYGIK